jgi:hypothetical protein
MYKYNRIRRIRGAHVGFLALLLILSTAPFGARAQNFRLVNSRQIPVIHAADTLVNAWAGGLNAAQFSTMDLNGDGVEDLVLFDRSTSKVSTFLAEPHGASYRWRYASRYEAYFPDMQAWMLLRDYDGDGKKDIFTRASFGAKVYRNVSAGGEIRFEQMVEFIETRGESGLINLSVLTDDIPAIVDMDGDGDLDIIVADQVGTYLRYHQNMSMETYGHADSLVYQLMNPCWGDFAEGADCDQYVFGIDCSWFSRPSSRPLRVQHAGSTILAIKRPAAGRCFLPEPVPAD